MLLISLVFLFSTAVLCAGPVTVWQAKAEQVISPTMLHNGVALVDDARASGGKAIRIPFTQGMRGHIVVFGAPQLALQGKCRFIFYLRCESMLPISDGLWITAVAHDKRTGEWAASDTAPVYGINLKPDVYMPVSLTLDLPRPDSYKPEVVIDWKVTTPDISPAVLLDRVEISTEASPAPVISALTMQKIRYLPGERAVVNIAVKNPGNKPATVTVNGEERWGLQGRRTAFSLPITLLPGEKRTIPASWSLGKEEYGREIAVKLLAGSVVTDSASTYFGVSRQPLWLSVANNPDAGGGPLSNTYSWYFYVGAAAMPESVRSMRLTKALSPGGECFEYFSWSGGDISDLSPQEEVFASNEGRMAFRSRELLRQQIVQLKSMGYWPVSYTNGTVWAESGYKLFGEHPEWFVYDGNGELAHYEMDRREIYRRRNDVDFDPNTYPTIYFQGGLNFALPEVQEYTARQFIANGKEMGFNGVRLDVAFPSVGVGERDLYGKEIVTTTAEADRQSAIIMRRVKALVHKELPDYTFGYNYGSPEEMLHMPLTSQERCAGGGWILDEVSCSYQEKTSPFHLWPAYAKRMVSWGDQINRWGGIYNPFDFRRNGPLYTIDSIYSSIFRLMAGGRSPYSSLYCNRRLPLGNLGCFATRYSEQFFGRDRRWIPEVKDEVAVHAAAPLWWKDMVYWNTDAAGHRQLIVNLVNPPKVEAVEENPRSELLPPVQNIEVTCAPLAGKSPRAAYLLSAEPMAPTDDAALQCLPLPLRTIPGGKVSATVSSVIFWKMVVFVY